MPLKRAMTKRSREMWGVFGKRGRLIAAYHYRPQTALRVGRVNCSWSAPKPSAKPKGKR